MARIAAFDLEGDRVAAVAGSGRDQAVAAVSEPMRQGRTAGASKVKG